MILSAVIIILYRHYRESIETQCCHQNEKVTAQADIHGILQFMYVPVGGKEKYEDCMKQNI
jgi:hypothetical protein